MHTVTVVVFATLCLLGTSSPVLADDTLKGELAPIKSEMKTEKDAMKAQDIAMNSEMKSKKGGGKGPITQYGEKMKAKRHEMMKEMKAHREAAMAKPSAPATVPGPVATPAPAL